jgi:hypothetical protein
LGVYEWFLRRPMNVTRFLMSFYIMSSNDGPNFFLLLSQWLAMITFMYLPLSLFS